MSHPISNMLFSQSSNLESVPQTQLGPKVTRGHSCVLCQQRKVRCDRQKPKCGNCIKARADCVPSAPTQPRRRRKKLSEIDMVAKLRRYEQLLKSHGVNLEDDEQPPGVAEAAAKERDFSSRAIIGIDVPRADNEEKGALFIHKQEAHYVENTLWENLRDEIANQKDVLHDIGSSDDETIETGMYPDAESFLVGHTFASKQLTSLHPQPVHIFRLWQTFLVNVNPLVKLFHAPSFQQIILDASASLDTVARPVEALMFSIYLLAVTSLTTEECENMFKETRVALITRYSHATQQALINSKFLKSLNMYTLQAYIIYLLAARNFYDAHSTWVLTGSAIRIAQRLGLHRDGSRYKISVFDAEMRRRTWWQICFLDGHASKLAGAGFPSWFAKFDTKIPLNVSDSDLSPAMKDLPKEKEGVTEMIFCCLRYEIASVVRSAAAFMRDGDSFHIQTGADIMEKKDQIIEDLNQKIREKFTKYCDPSIPLHLLVIYVSKAVISSLKIMAHHPRQYPDKGASMPQAEKDMLFEESLKGLEVDSLGFTVPAVKGYLWHIQHYFQLDAFIYILSELGERLTGDRVDRAWKIVGLAYECHPEMIENTKNALYVAMGNLCLKAWRKREEDGLTSQDGRPIKIPQFINQLRELRKGSQLSKPGKPIPNSQKEVSQHTQASHEIEYTDSNVLQEMYQYNAEQFAGIDLAPDMEMPELTSVDWEYWQTLMKGDMPAYNDVGRGFFN